MAYTNEWDDDFPTGGEAAGNIDDIIRRVALAIHERMDDLVVDWTADPVTLNTGLSAGMINIPNQAFISTAAANVAIYANEKLTAPYSTTLIAPVIIPSGHKITKVDWWISKNTCTSVTVALVKYSTAYPPVPGVVSTVTDSVGTTHLVSATLAASLLGGSAYFLQITAIGSGGNTFEFHSARVTYEQDI